MSLVRKGCSSSMHVHPVPYKLVLQYSTVAQLRITIYSSTSMHSSLNAGIFPVSLDTHTQ
eukprot:m.302203 g.302203  ORF g.302203 m.302203 type:complete len:60 (-) comp15886_c1_seq9:5696-5875(-)